MLDTIKIGLLRLDTKSGKTHGYMRIVPKNDSEGQVHSYFRIPLHVVFDKEGYNSYKEYRHQENPEYKTWVEDVVINVPPSAENAIHYPNGAYEWLLGNLRDLTLHYPHFPRNLKNYIEESIRDYAIAKKQLSASEDSVEDDYDPPPMNRAQLLAAQRALTIYGMLQRSRFDPGRNSRRGEFLLPPFYRNKADKSAKELIEDLTQVVCDYVWKNPKVSKYSETEGFSLKIKLSLLFMACIFKEQILFMKSKLQQSVKSGDNPQ